MSSSQEYVVWYRHSGEEEQHHIPRMKEGMRRSVRDVNEIVTHIGTNHITHMCIKGEIIPSLNSIAPNLTHLKIENIRDVQQLERLIGLKQLEVLDLRNNAISALPNVLSSLIALRELYLVKCRFNASSDMSGLSGLTQLELLHLDHNTLSSLPNELRKLTKLKELRLYNCGLSDSSSMLCLAELKELEVLGLHWNSFTAMPKVIFGLTNLKELNLFHCNLSESSDMSGLLKLKKLEVLNLSNNAICKLPSDISALNNLRKLYLGKCGFTESSEMSGLSGLEKLEVLSIRDNSISTLPDAVSSLTNLRELFLVDCNLSDSSNLSGLRRTVKLEVLQISSNEFKELPEEIYDLRNLKSLNISSSKKLETIDGQLLTLKNLKSIDCADCVALKSPQYAICKEGLPTIQKYFRDMEEAQDEVTVMPVAVIGETMAGKTTLIKSAQAEKRILIPRKDPRVGATKVFEMKEWNLGDAKVLFVDFGGHEIYHIAYQFAIKTDSVACLVINMKSYQDLASLRGRKEATRKVCFDWISHVYLRCPRLGAPILVLTHKDQLKSEEEFEFCRTELLETAEEIRMGMLNEELEATEGKGGFCLISHLADTTKPLFHKDDIFVFSDDLNQTDNIQAFKVYLAERCKKFKKTIPHLWKRMDNHIDGRSSEPYIPLSDLQKEFPAEDVELVLRYLCNIGKVMWFEGMDGLNDYIFYPKAVTEMLCLLFDHSSAELWKKRVDNFVSFKCNKRMIYLEEYKQLVKRFVETGIVDEALLVEVFKNDKRFPHTLALRVLDAFYIIYGPIHFNPRKSYTIPTISTQFLERLWKRDGRLQIRMDIKFEGLPLPQYVYQLFTVAVLKLHAEDRNPIHIARNGATIKHGSSTTSLVHDHSLRTVTVQISTDVEQLGSAWKRLLEISRSVIKQTMKEWKATRPVCTFYCSHCIFIGHETPDHQVNPRWFEFQTSEDSKREGEEDEEQEIAAVRTYSDIEPVECCNTPNTVPTPLKLPCYDLLPEHILKLKTYLTDLKGQVPNMVTPQTFDTVKLVGIQDTSEAEADSDLSDDEVEGYVDFEDLKNQKLALKLAVVRRQKIKDLYNNTKKVYAMSGESKGRVMIINNRNFTDAAGVRFIREGSEHDYHNISKLFQTMKFDLAKSQKDLSDLTAAQILSEIEEETRSPMHHSCRMFILVVMSYGSSSDTIFGADFTTLNLVHIKDRLSANKFRAMAGKPKLIIIQACSGERVDLGEQGAMSLTDDLANVKRAYKPYPQDATERDKHDVTSERVESLPDPPSQLPEGVGRPQLPPGAGQLHDIYLNTDDFFIMKPSNESFIATRSKTHGSWFIRILVATFYKHANHYDVEELFKIIQDRVRKVSLSYMQRTDSQRAGGNVPTSLCTFTNRRKLYLFPGYSGGQRQSIF